MCWETQDPQSDGATPLTPEQLAKMDVKVLRRISDEAVYEFHIKLGDTVFIRYEGVLSEHAQRMLQEKFERVLVGCKVCLIPKSMEVHAIGRA